MYINGNVGVICGYAGLWYCRFWSCSWDGSCYMMYAGIGTKGTSNLRRCDVERHIK